MECRHDKRDGVQVDIFFYFYGNFQHRWRKSLSLEVFLKVEN